MSLVFHYCFVLASKGSVYFCFLFLGSDGRHFYSALSSDISSDPLLLRKNSREDDLSSQSLLPVSLTSLW